MGNTVSFYRAIPKIKPMGGGPVRISTTRLTGKNVLFRTFQHYSSCSLIIDLYNNNNKKKLTTSLLLLGVFTDGFFFPISISRTIFSPVQTQRNKTNVLTFFFFAIFSRRTKMQNPTRKRL